jgi:dihydrofolate reductase
VTVSLVVAVGADGAIGRDGALPWRAAEDMAYFKRVTMGHTLVIGRLTWESIGRPLPGRRIVVVSRSAPADLPDTVVGAGSPDEGLAVALDTDPEPVVAGGATIYDALLPLVGRVHRTTVDVAVPDADTWFPALPTTDWQLVSRQPGVDERLTFEVLERIEPPRP